MLDFTAVIAQLPRMAAGAQTTIWISAAALLCGAALGLVMCAARLSRNIFLRALAAVFVSMFRGLPLLVVLLILFYVPPNFGVETTPLTAALLGLTLNTAGYQTEIYRAGFLTVPPGHAEAARMLGFSRLQIARHIFLPQIFRVTIPALTNEAVDVVKSSGLLSIIAVTELLRISQQIVSSTYRPLETYLVCGLFYFLMSTAVSSFGRFLERRLTPKPA
ncbi:amino acid ABC transporter permease [Flaviflagellibacter deserti]|uniref:Amino acid ABC transporter permease n=1 Tax=Flaviflagellibacter deserti TaxID=2267266 RepID=A0ABV9Z4S1_9HYPH